MIHFNLRGYTDLIDGNRRTLQDKLGLSRQRVATMVGGDLVPNVATVLRVLNALGIEETGWLFYTDGETRGSAPSSRPADLVERNP